jgi:hypothetical protein
MSVFSLFDMILKKHLYFHPLHLLEDDWEGLPLPLDEKLLTDYELSRSGDPELAAIHVDLLRVGRYTGCVSCWHQAEIETMAMWKIYAGNAHGCCVIVNKDQMTSWAESLSIVHFPVTYVDRNTECKIKNPVSPLHYSATYKHKAYEYEQEYRFWETSEIEPMSYMKEGAYYTKPDISKSKIEKGIYAEFDLATVVDRIMVSPFLANFEQDTIVKIVERLCGASIAVGPSTLAVKR